MRPRALRTVPLLFTLFCCFVSRSSALEIVFAVREPKGPHWYENFGHSITGADKAVYGSLGQLCKLDTATGNLTVLVDDRDGAIRDPQVHYTGSRILFS